LKDDITLRNIFAEAVNRGTRDGNLVSKY
jgi:hypothetical protein